MTPALHRRAIVGLGYALGVLICEPQVRLGRRRHDGDCDRCDESIDRYAMDKLDFPDVDLEESTSREKLRSMLNAEYRRVCLECSAELEAEEADQR